MDLNIDLPINPGFLSGGDNMLSWAATFLVIAIIAAVLGFTGIAGAAAGIAKILFVIFLVVFVVSLIFGRRAV
jgi:uncharacterized membrane protein YtjA (UPF0391 family)